VIWSQGIVPPRRCDLPAYRLGRIIVDRVLGPNPAAASRLPPASDLPEFAEQPVRGGSAVGVPD